MEWNKSVDGYVVACTVNVAPSVSFRTVRYESSRQFSSLCYASTPLRPDPFDEARLVPPVEGLECALTRLFCVVGLLRVTLTFRNVYFV